jgi:tRNA-modifying protein YgfZ
MTDKQDAVSAAFPLPGWQVVEVAGSDAAAFLQAQTMNDVRLLAPGQWQWNGWLNPKGRVIALFALIALDAGEFLLLVPDFPAEELVVRLQRFVFRSKVRLRMRDDVKCLGTFAQPLHAAASAIDRTTQGETQLIELDLGAQGGGRTLRLEGGQLALLPTGQGGVARQMRGHEAAAVPSRDSSTSLVRPLTPAPFPVGEGRWAAFDLAHGLPHLALEQSEQWTPQMLSLERLNAFSLKKGCYPGQEIVARTHYLGQAKRSLARLSGTNLVVGADVVANGRTLGTIIDSSGEEALAVLAADRPQGSWECSGSVCRELTLRPGLER